MRLIPGLALLGIVAVVVILLIVYRKPVYGKVCEKFKGIGMKLDGMCCKNHVLSTCYGPEGLIGQIKDVGCSTVMSPAEFKKKCKK